MTNGEGINYNSSQPGYYLAFQFAKESSSSSESFSKNVFREKELIDVKLRNSAKNLKEAEFLDATKKYDDLKYLAMMPEQYMAHMLGAAISTINNYDKNLENHLNTLGRVFLFNKTIKRETKALDDLAFSMYLLTDNNAQFDYSSAVDKINKESESIEKFEVSFKYISEMKATILDANNKARNLIEKIGQVYDSKSLFFKSQLIDMNNVALSKLSESSTLFPYAAELLSSVLTTERLKKLEDATNDIANASRATQGNPFII